MAEPRRIQLTTLSCGSPGPEPELFPGSDREPDLRSLRLVLQLFEPDEKNFPEFSYSQLLEDQIKQTECDAPLSPLEEKDEIAAIARRLEEKYGDKPRKKKDRIQDLIDIGYGYDDEDSFIDNSEAYDEFVPASITTKFGGFYVNSGVLQYRQASGTETDEPKEKKTSEQKKRKHTGGQEKPKTKRHRPNGERTISSDANARNPGKAIKMKRKKTLSVTSMLKKFQREKEREQQKEARAVAAAASPLPADPAGGCGLGMADPLLSLIGLTNDQALIQAASTVDFDVDLDSLLDLSEETVAVQSDHALPIGLTDATVTNPPDSQPRPSPEQIQLLCEGGSGPACAQLPDGLPPRLEESVRKLTQAAKTSEGESKLKFFSPDINSILLDIELQCREQAGPLRSKVYTHLSSFLPCSRDTLLKRAKRLVVTHTEENLGEEDSTRKMKEALGRSMPEQIACFKQHCQAYEQSKSSKAANEDGVEEKCGRIGPPKKIFKWNEEIRECLSLFLNEKINKYNMDRKEGLETEEYLKTLLDNEVKPLWPKGWMQSRLLLSESRKLLGLVPPLPIKRTKTDKKQSDMSERPAATALRVDAPPPAGTALRVDAPPPAGTAVRVDAPPAAPHKFGFPTYLPAAVTEVKTAELGQSFHVDTPAEPDRAGVGAPPAPTPRFPHLPPATTPGRPPAAPPATLQEVSGGTLRAEEVQIYIISDDDDNDGCLQMT